MFGKLKLRGRILLGYAIPLPLTILISGVVYSNSNKIGQLIQSFNAAQEGLAITDNVESDVSGMDRSTRGYILTKKQIHLDEFKKRYQEFIEDTQNTEKLMKGEKKQFFNQEQQKLYEQLKRSGERMK